MNNVITVQAALLFNSDSSGPNEDRSQCISSCRATNYLLAVSPSWNSTEITKW